MTANMKRSCDANKKGRGINVRGHLGFRVSLDGSISKCNDCFYIFLIEIRLSDQIHTNAAPEANFTPEAKFGGALPSRPRHS
jgi:hypothetical protein